MAKREYTDEEIVDLYKFLPVSLEIGEYTLYDTNYFLDYYPDLMDEFFWKRGDWMELFYNNIENRQSEPRNYLFIRFLEADIKEMLDDDETPEWKQMFIAYNETEDLIKEFYDEFISINHGVTRLLDEWHEMFCQNTHSGLETIFLNLFTFDHTLNIDSWKLIQRIVNDPELQKFSRRNTIKTSEMIRNKVFDEPDFRSRNSIPDFLMPEKRIFRNSHKGINFYDHLYTTLSEQIDEDYGADYNFRIIANLLPLLYHGLIRA